MKQLVPKSMKALLVKQGIRTNHEQRVERFNEWMKKIGNIYYFNHERMCNAFERVD